MTTTCSTPREYADAIGAAWRETTEGVLRTAELYAAARHQGLLNDLDGMVPHSGSTARKLALVGNWWRQSVQPQNIVAGDLPPHWGTLYTLSRVDPAQLRNLVGAGTIHPGMERADAEALVPKKAKAAASGGAQLASQVLVPGNTAAAPCASATPTLLGAVEMLSALRDAGQPSQYAQEVPRTKLALALAFLTAVHKLAK